MSDPKTIIFMTSNLCNLHCHNCLRQKKNIDAPNITWPVVERVMRRVTSPEKIIFGGYGEPLMNPGLFDIVKKLPDQRLWLQTNGVFIDQFRREFEETKNNWDDVRISLGAGDAVYYETTKGKNYFDKILKNIEILNNIILGKVSLEFVINKQNISEIHKFAGVAKNSRIKQVHFVNHQSFNTDFETETIKINDIETVQWLMEAQGDPIFSDVIEWPIPWRKGQKFCTMKDNTLVVDGNGLTSICPRLMNIFPIITSNPEIHNSANKNVDHLYTPVRTPCQFCPRNCKWS